jgi:hypothetical protein
MLDSLFMAGKSEVKMTYRSHGVQPLKAALPSRQKTGSAACSQMLVQRRLLGHIFLSGMRFSF